MFFALSQNDGKEASGARCEGESGGVLDRAGRDDDPEKKRKNSK